MKQVEAAFLTHFNSKVPIRYYTSVEGLNCVLAKMELGFDDVLGALCDVYGKPLARKIVKEPRVIRVNAHQLENTRDYLYANFGVADTQRMVISYPRIVGFTKRYISDKVVVL